MTKEQFIDLSILCGCDYCGTIKGGCPIQITVADTILTKGEGGSPPSLEIVQRCRPAACVRWNVGHEMIILPFSKQAHVLKNRL